MSDYSTFHASLNTWYQQHGRHHLPWRQTEDAYAIWVSEVMLQQTQVKTVLDRFYFPFLERFPSFQALAEADLQDVLQLWQGLGYYSRAKNLHLAAQELANQRRNTLPASPSELITLPGIGQNTAHAISAFAFRQPVAILEVNVKRVIARIFALKTPSAKELWHHAAALLNRQNPFDYNQAMMDVGSLICTPKAPLCGQCPAATLCQGKSAPEAFPQKKPKAAIPTRKCCIILYQNPAGHYAIRPRSSRFLHGLWEFPEADTPPKPARKIGEIRHAYSHFHLEAAIYTSRDISIEIEKDKAWHWRPLSEITTLPLSRTEKKILALLENT